jgi:hypothetical protein
MYFVAVAIFLQRPKSRGGTFTFVHRAASTERSALLPPPPEPHQLQYHEEEVDDVEEDDHRAEHVFLRTQRVRLAPRQQGWQHSSLMFFAVKTRFN